MKNSKAIYIRPETVCIGDTIRVREMVQDVEVLRIGLVAKREHYTHGTEYMTKSGVVLFTLWRTDVETRPRITLLARAHNVTELELKTGTDGVLF